MKDLDRYRGCLIDDAIGVALGYAVELIEDSRFFQKCGERGVAKYDLADDVVRISDDNQMTLFTANGLLPGTTKRTHSQNENRLLYVYVKNTMERSI